MDFLVHLYKHPLLKIMLLLAVFMHPLLKKENFCTIEKKLELDIILHYNWFCNWYSNDRM